MTTPPPPPPTYAPTAGLSTTWWDQTSAAVWTPERVAAAEDAQQRLAASMHELSRAITETPQERQQRLRDEQRAAAEAARAADDERRAKAGETPRQRDQRHRAEDRAQRQRERAEERRRQRRDQRAASRLWSVDPGERARRFRRWCVLTALSASAGYSVGLVQLVSTLPPLVTGFFVLPVAYGLDVKMRGGLRDAARLSDLRGARPIAAVVLARVPISSVLASLLHLDRLLAASGHLFHH